MRSVRALEPVEAPTDAFNDPALADALALAPRASRGFSFGVELTLAAS